jgi:transposase
LQLPAPYAARIGSLRRLIETLEFEIDHFAGMARGRLARDPGYQAVQTIPGIGPVLAAVFVAGIGDVGRFAGPEQLACWAGLTPKHHESDTHVQRGRITKQGSRLVRRAAVESVKRLPAHTLVGGLRDRVADRRGATSAPWPPPAGKPNWSTTRCATDTSAPSNLGRRHDRHHPLRSVAGRAGHDPCDPRRGRPT